MAEYRAIAAVGEVPQNGFRCVAVGDRSVLVARLDDAYHAVENRCSHAESSFEGGRLRGPLVICPRHGARFDVRTGACVTGPAHLPIARFPVRLRDGFIEALIDPSDDGRDASLKGSVA